MILGSHESSAGGLHLAFERASRDKADALQLWTRSSRQWAAKPLTDDVVSAFREAHRGYARPALPKKAASKTKTGQAVIPTAAHAAYLINLAAADDALLEKSVTCLLDECIRAEALGVSQVIVHPGAHQGRGVAEGLHRVAAALRVICNQLGNAKVRLLLEFTAGQGSCVGASFAELAAMLDGAGENRLGICLDTQHMYAAGVDWTTPEGYEATFKAFDKTIGLRHLEAFHLNDSKKPLGGRVDRHEIIGEGKIGLAPFARLLTDERFARVPGYLETPPLPSGEESYALSLERLRSLL